MLSGTEIHLLEYPPTPWVEVIFRDSQSPVDHALELAGKRQDKRGAAEHTVLRGDDCDDDDDDDDGHDGDDDDNDDGDDCDGTSDVEKIW